MVGNKAFVQQFVAHVLREDESRRNHRVLPGDVVLGDGRVVVPISFPDDAVVHRMVHQHQAKGEQGVILRLVLREEAHIKIGRVKGDAAGLGGIDRRQRLLHVGDGIRVLQLLTEDYHPVPESRSGNIPRGAGLRAVPGAGTKRRQKRQVTEILHSSSVQVRLMQSKTITAVSEKKIRLLSKTIFQEGLIP